MASEPRLALALALAGVAAYLLTPVAIQAAGRLDFFDKPKGYKGHAKPIPYLGGSAVLAAFVVVLMVLAGDLERTVPLVTGVAILWGVGTVDDRRHLSPLVRVIIEVGVATGIWAAGLGWDAGLGAAIELPLTILWILAVVNAFNLFDNMDGASSAMAAVVSLAVAALGLWQHDAWLTAAGAALAGSCLGFLPYNLARPQARIFLGDGGSMPIGFAIGALVMTGASTAAAGWEALAVGFLLVAVPAADTALVIISRRRKGISILQGGRDHLTHRARRRLGTARAVALSLGALQATVAAIALVALDVGPPATITATVVLLALGGTIITMLEREEDRLLAAGEVVVPDEALERAAARRATRPDPLTLGDGALVVFALGAALSPLAFGFYASSAWVPIGLALLLVAAMGVIRRPQRLGVAAWLMLGGLTAIGLVALASAGWAVSADQAIESANRWLVLAVIAGLALTLMRSARRDVIAIATLALGTAFIAAVVICRMLGTDGSDLFLGGRLHEPLGYINAQATVFIMGIWLCFAAVEQRRAWLAGLGMTGATVMAGLAMLSQSRGAALAALVAVVVVLVAVPGRARRAFALLVLAAAVAAAAGPLLDVYDVAMSQTGDLDGAIRQAAGRLLLTAVAAGVIWAVAVAIHGRLSDEGKRMVRQAGVVTLAVLGGGALVTGLLSAGSIGDRVASQWESFTNVVTPAEAASAPSAVAEGSRLVSGAGNRYDYWRVAWDAFGDHPVGGLGAGNFDQVWLRERAVSEDVRQPHSIELQVLSELGVVGGAGLALLVLGFLAGLLALHRTVRSSPTTRVIGVAAAGVPAAWLAHTSVDWQHLLPGTTAVALIALAVLVRQPDRVRDSARPASATHRDRSQFAVASLVAGALVVALIVATIAATLTRQGFAGHYRAAAYEVVASDPEQAIVEADRSLRLNADAVRTYYAKAAALARLNQGAAAEAVLREAIAREPSDPVTWALLGDLATRRGNPDLAARAYATALRLSPLDPGYRELVRRTGEPSTGSR